jgi:hypothetical protein
MRDKMRRTLGQAFDALRAQVHAWARGEAKPDLRVFVYPPEWEAIVLARLPSFADACRADDEPVELCDLGQAFLAELEQREGLIDRLHQLSREEMLHDLGWIATTCLRRSIRAPLEGHTVCRIFMNTGALATFASYSAVANEFGGISDPQVPASVLAFPGEADERSLNLLRLRVDTNYRVPRI